MRICIVAEIGPGDGVLGGAESQAWTLATSLAERGHEVVHIAVGAKSGGEDTSGPVRRYRLAAREPVRRRVSRVREILVRGDFDVCYVRDFRWFAFAARLCRDLPTRLVLQYYSLSQCWSAGQTIRLAMTPPITRKKLVTALDVAWGNLLGAKAADAVFCQTREQQALLRETYGIEARVVPNAYEGPRADPRGDAGRVLWVGKDFKRPELFVDLAEQLGPEFGSVFDLACRISPSGRGAGLLERVAACSWLTHYGDAQREDVTALYRASALLVSTSRLEGFPNVFLEAWAMGLPVVSLGVDPDGVLETQGVGVHVDDPAALRDAVRALLLDVDRRATMGRTAVEYVARCHEPRAVCELVERELARLVEGAGS